MEINLINKTAWVFGGSRGIGKAIAIELANSGANILLLARNTRTLDDAVKSLCTRQNQEHDVLCVDMSRPQKLFNSIQN